MKRLLGLTLPLIIFAVMVALFYQALGKDPQELPSALAGKPLPEFELTDLLDESAVLTSADLPQRPYLLNVWATWCPSCLVEHPLLNQLSQQGVVLVGLNYKDIRPAAAKYLTNHGNPFATVIFDEEGSLGFDLGVYGAPETFFVDHQGRVVDRFVGVPTPQVWQQKLLPIYHQMMQAYQP